ncbi:YdcF family protein [Ruminococcus sp.]|uniref:YdcF family protein n=1 Tax=Ruminococcus sp. TaxID=41978 RepID=UPI0025F0E423|nr:YdcF family protein [Ruminococcus sp.]
MRIRYLFLIPELILLFFFVAPVFKRICNPGNIGGALGCLFLIALTLFPHALGQLFRRIWEHLPGKIGLSVLGVLVAAGLIFSGIMSVQMARAIADTPKTPETVVVLGCKVRGTKPSAMLTRRLEAALEYLDENPSVSCVVTGGQGAGEDIPEGQAMKLWLVEHGVAEERILVEDQSTDTQENLRNAAEILEENRLGTEIVIVTDGFHQYRAELLAEKAGLEASAYSAYTNPLYVPTYWVREWMALFQLLVLGHG